jgi:Inner membrane protein YgaP-like, transmembrane domain
MTDMNVDRLVLTFAGVFILGSLILSQIHSPYWLFFTAFVGLNLFQASFTGFCPLAKILKAMGARAGVVFKV